MIRTVVNTVERMIHANRKPPCCTRFEKISFIYASRVGRSFNVLPLKQRRVTRQSRAQHVCTVRTVP